MEEQGDVSFFSTLSPFGVEVLAVASSYKILPCWAKGQHLLLSSTEQYSSVG